MSKSRKNRKDNYAKSLLRFLKSQGFVPDEHKKVLELGQTPSESISQYIKQCNPYLLTYLSTEEEIKHSGLDGSYGKIIGDDIVYTNSNGEPYSRKVFKNPPSGPRLHEFDAVICQGITSRAFDVAQVSEEISPDLFCCFRSEESDKNLRFQFQRAEELLRVLAESGKNYEMIKHPEGGKVYCLIKKAK